MVSMEIVCTVHSACAVHRQNQVNVAPVSVAEPCPQMVTISNLGTGGLTDSIKTFGVLIEFALMSYFIAFPCVSIVNGLVSVYSATLYDCIL
ncbi:hypothetical protein Patl1_33931 [Pistacia atlantica]|uniref:Uncharacterized protein n=1 Tax=Pistacia atlantica TaxID=434234 RepID=A0ACC0ZV15_9ROSI|nr:hypothetical protein Patl1_33931 [Pistacia atlantica]